MVTKLPQHPSTGNESDGYWMHYHDQDSEKLAEAVVEYALDRIRLDPPPLDGPKTLSQLEALVGNTITPEGLGGLGDAGRELLVLHRARRLGLEELHAADPQQRQDRDRQHDDSHAAEPLQRAAPHVQALHAGWQDFPGLPPPVPAQAPRNR